jgi:ribosomal protein L40E
MITRDQLVGERSRLTSSVIAIVVLAILAGAAYKIPEAYRLVAGRLSIGGIIRLALLAIILGLLITSRSSLKNVISYYAGLSLKVDRTNNPQSSWQHIDGLSNTIANVIVLAIAWPLNSKIVSIILQLDTDGTFDWLPVLVTVGFVVWILYSLYTGYAHLKPTLEIHEAEKMKGKCPKCGAQNSNEAKFCAFCGADLEPVPVQPVKQGNPKICLKCGGLNVPEASYCAWCGAALQEETSEVKPPPTSEEHSYQSCPACGAKNRVNTRYCTSCGAQLVSSNTVEQKQKEYIVCPDCGAENRFEAKYCEACGRLLAEERIPQTLANEEQKRDRTPSPFRNEGSLSPSGIFTPIHSTSELLESKPRLLALIGAILLFISLQMTWVSTKPIFGIQLTLSSSDFSNELIMAGVLCGLAALGATFLYRVNPRRWVHIIAGIIPLFILLMVWTSDGGDGGEFSEIERALEEEIMKWITIREGLYLYVLSCIALIVAGISEKQVEK